MADNPIGGAEAAFLNLARALNAKGHDVTTLTSQAGWWHELRVQSLDTPRDFACDMFIASRSTRLLPLTRHARKGVFWVHNPATYLAKARNLLKLWRYQPMLITTSAYQRRTVPLPLRWLPAQTIPHGLDAVYLNAPSRQPPPPVAVFTSQPQRGLEWLFTLWRKHIINQCPNAQLWAFTGYQKDAVNSAIMARIRANNHSLEQDGIFIKPPVPAKELAHVLLGARVMLYPSDKGETFCLAAAEAQACGVPLVTRPIGCLPERVVDGKTGFVCRDDDAFAKAAVRLLNDDAHWQACHDATRTAQTHHSWETVADRFLALA